MTKRKSQTQPLIWSCLVSCVLQTERSQVFYDIIKSCVLSGWAVHYIFWSISTLCWVWHTSGCPILYFMQYVAYTTLVHCKCWGVHYILHITNHHSIVNTDVIHAIRTSKFHHVWWTAILLLVGSYISWGIGANILYVYLSSFYTPAMANKSSPMLDF